MIKKNGNALAGWPNWFESHPVLNIKRWQVQFPVSVHAWVAGQVPSLGCAKGNQKMYLWHIAVSPPLFLPPFPSKNK